MPSPPGAVRDRATGGASRAARSPGATGAAAAITLPVLAARHTLSGVDGAQLAGIIAGGGVATALAAALGVGIGTVIHNQAGAVIAILSLLYVAEPLLGFIPHLGTAVQT
jgi:hypothetical protein